MSGVKIVTGEHPEEGTLFAAVDPAAQFVGSKVCGSRLMAYLAPFRDEQAARAALKEAGAPMESGH